MGSWEEITRGLDPARQLPAVRETRSAVVSAGAGSGKTRVLAVRYLHLVKERGIPPERILCLTFTKKAAAEMSERIRGMLAACARDDDDFARALAAFPSSRVSTLDAFCSEVARSGCSRWGVPPDFSVDAGTGASPLDALAVGFLLKRRHEPVTASFIAASGFERAAEALAAFAGGREGLIASERRLDAAEQSEAVAACLTRAHATIRELLAGGAGLDPGSAKGAQAWRERAGRFPAEAPGQDDADGLKAALAEYRSLRSLHIATGKSEGAIYYNAAGKEARRFAEAAALACEALLDTRREGTLGLLGEFAEEAAESRAASGALSFSDVAAIALRTLETDLAIRDWYKSRYDAIMVDEFQDDNELQKRVLYCVAERRDRTDPGRGPTVGPEDLEPGALFFVGDEKQSIYAFRGADVTVFRGLADELAAAPGGLGWHSLDINWRSEPGLIDFFNATFSRVLPAPDDPAAQDYEARFSGLESGGATPGVRPEAVYLESNEPSDDGYVSSSEAEAWGIAELVRSLVEGGAVVAAKGPGGQKIARPCRYDDIAVLFRSTTSQNVVERYFRLLGIPYTAASTAGLFAESVLGDLYAMLRLAVYPDDSLAFATALRGPFARLSDESAFAALSSPCDGPEGYMGFDSASLPADDGRRFLAARETWLGVRERADREPLRRLVEYLWYDRGLRWNVLKDPSSASFLEHFDYAWSLAAAADGRGERLVDLVAALEPKIGKLDRFDDAVLRESSRGVSIMTVHMSKGLEFPVVILPDVDSKGRGDVGSPVSRSERFGTSARLLDADDVPGDPVAELASALRRIERGEGADAMDESIAETARLFYVACTRAISRLYLVGKVPRNADAKGQSFRGLFLEAWPWAGPASLSDEEFLSDRPDDAPEGLSVGYIRPRSKEDYVRLANASGPAGEGRAKASAEAPPRAVAERRGRWSVTAAAAVLSGDGSREAGREAGREPFREAAREPGDEEGRGLSEADFGTLCHQFVEDMLREPGKEPEARGPVGKALERLPASIRMREAAEARALALAFTSSARGAEAAAFRDSASPGAFFEIEYPFVWRRVAESGLPVVLSGSIDLVYGDADRIIIVDFKTDRRMDPEKHAFQLSVYRDAAESIFGAPARAFVSYLRTGSEFEICGDAFSTGISRL
ncbi:MAG: UvrD-helicase domain-containing protein [Spirochaetes bacterium]|nr:UvrD-helicase domain-containing protein [Spirochaetota bacterium]MBU1081706.1 UvrD-helicase domain-containing protein [Spirochaetota bacterium]